MSRSCRRESSSRGEAVLIPYPLAGRERRHSGSPSGPRRISGSNRPAIRTRSPSRSARTGRRLRRHLRRIPGTGQTRPLSGMSRMPFRWVPFPVPSRSARQSRHPAPGAGLGSHVRLSSGGSHHRRLSAPWPVSPHWAFCLRSPSSSRGTRSESCPRRPRSPPFPC